MKRLSTLFFALAVLTPFTAEAECVERLFVTAQNGDTYTLKRLLDAGGDPTCYYVDTGNTVLHWATSNGHANAIAMLIEAGADPNARNNNLITPLHLAAGIGHTEAIAVLVNAGANPNVPDKSGDVSLHYAAYKDAAFSIIQVMGGFAFRHPWHMETDPLVRRLFRMLADLGNADASGSLSSWGDSSTAIVALLSAGADPSVKNKDGRTPQYYADSYSADVEDAVKAAATLRGTAARE